MLKDKKKILIDWSIDVPKKKAYMIIAAVSDFAVCATAVNAIAADTYRLTITL